MSVIVSVPPSTSENINKIKYKKVSRNNLEGFQQPTPGQPYKYIGPIMYVQTKNWQGAI